jgi:hypothetical protein
VMIITGAGGDGDGARALGSALIAVFFLLTATAGATLARTRAELAWFGTATAILSVGALAGTIFAIWGDPSEGQGQATAIAGVLAVAGAQTSLLLGPRYRDSSDRILLLRNVTIAALAALAGLIVYAISGGDSPNAKLITIVAILYVLGSLVLPIAQRSEGRSSMLQPLESPRGSAADLLRANGYVLVDGPRPAAGGKWTRLLAPDGRLVDVTAYEKPSGEDAAEHEPARD